MSSTLRQLKAYVGILVHPLTNGLNQYYIVTIVHYLHWTGPVYFNLIRPFHRKNPKTTVVVIEEVDTDNWGIDGQSVTVRRKPAL